MVHASELVRYITCAVFTCFSDSNWECNAGEEVEPSKTDDSNVYGIDNLEYLNKEIQSYRPKYDENQHRISDTSDTSDSVEEQIVVVSSEDVDSVDENNIEIIDDYNLPNETAANGESDEVDYSGDGSDDNANSKDNDNVPEKKETYIAIPVNSDPNKSVASHLQRLSQLIQSLKDSQTNKSQSYDLGPNDLNSFLSHHNIKAEYDHHLKNQKKKHDIPMDGRIHPDHLAEILELQHKLQSLESIQNGEYLPATTEPMIDIGKYPVKSTIQIKSPTPVKNVRITDPNGYTSSQIVVNRPEGSVLFTLPNNAPQSPAHPQYQYQSPYSPTPIPPPAQQEPYVSQETLKTVLELSKQLISSSNHQQAIQNYIPEQNYLQPIFRPIYYNIPIHELPVPIINNYEKKESKHDDNKGLNDEPNYVKITSVSGYIDPTTPKSTADTDDDKTSDEHSTIIHNHIPITIENPFQQTAKKPQKIGGPTVAPISISTASGLNQQFDEYQPQSYGGVYNNRPYRPYPEFNEGSYASYLTEQQLPNTNPTYSNPGQYLQPNGPPNSAAYFAQPYQQQQQQQFYPGNGFPQSFYTQQTHLNDNNVNHYVNFNVPQYPTLRPASLSSLTASNSMYQNQNNDQSVTPKAGTINTYQSFDENENKNSEQQQQNEPTDDELPTMLMDNSDDDDNSVEQDDNTNDYYETNEEDNIAADINTSNVMNLLANLQNQKIPSIQNKQLPAERAPINPFLINANDDTKRKVVHFGDNFLSIDEYEKLVQPLINRDALVSNNVDVIPCVTGARQPLAKDCTKYMVCNGATTKVLTYTCPPFTAFNQQSRFCDAKTFGICKKDELSTASPSALDVINENKRLQQQADKELQLAQQERDQALKTQQLAALIKQQTQNILNPRPSTVKRPLRNRRKKVTVKATTSVPYYRTRPQTKKRKNKPIIRRIPCKEPSKVADTLSIYNYFTCYKGADGALKARKMSCPNGLVFCERIRLCTSSARCGSWSGNVRILCLKWLESDPGRQLLLLTN